MLRKLSALFAGALLGAFAFGQSVPNGGITQGQIWTLAQWQAAWQAKADASSGTLTSPTINGGVQNSPAINNPTVTGGSFATPTINGVSITVPVPNFPRTAAEIAAGVTPVNFGFATGNALRYGADPTGSADSAAAIQAAINANQNGIVLFPQGTYRVSGPILLTDSGGHNFQGQLVGQNSTITFTNAGNATDADSAMQHGFQAYPKVNGTGGDTSGLQGVLIEGFNFVGPTHGTPAYLANSLGVIFQHNTTTTSRYGLVLETSIDAKVLYNTFNNYTNAGLGMLMTGNTGNVYYGTFSGTPNGNPSATYWNDGQTISGNVFQTAATNFPLAHILDYGSQSESIRFVTGNSFFSANAVSGVFEGTQYGYVGRSFNVTLHGNWFENINYPVRVLAGNVNETTNLVGVSGAEPSGTFAVAAMPDGFSYFGSFKGNYFTRGLIDLNLNGIQGGSSNIGQNISEFLQNGGTHVSAQLQGSTMVVDDGDTILVPIGAFTYGSFAFPTYVPNFNVAASYTPTVTASSGAITSFTVNKAIYSQIKPDLVWVSIDITITNNGTGSGTLAVSLPTVFATPITGTVSGRNFITDTNTITGVVGSSGVVLTRYDGVYPVVTGDRFVISGTYQF